MPKLNWSDADEIGFALHEKYADVDPLTVRFTDLRRRVLDLQDFAGQPDASSEGILEAIQMAWVQYHRQDP